MRAGVDVVARTLDGVEIKFSFSGAGARSTAGIDKSLRWFAAGGFYAPTGSKVTLGTDNMQHRRTDYPWAIAGKGGKPLVALDNQRRFIVHGFRALEGGEIAGGLAVGNALTVGGSLTVAGAFSVSTIAPNARNFVAGTEKSVEADWHWAITGAGKRVMLGVRAGDVHMGRAGSSTRLSMLYADAANMARGRTTSGTPHNIRVQSLNSTAYCLTLGYGQSLMSAQESWPAIPRTPEPNTLMMGLSVRPTFNYSANFVQQGPASFTDLASTTDDYASGGKRAPMTAAAVAALAPGAANEGEAMPVEAVRHLARGWADQPGAPMRKFVAAVTSVGGQTIEQLSKGAAGTELYLRNTQAVSLFKTFADPLGTNAVTAILFAQGEWNYYAAYNGTQDYAAYLALLQTLRNNLNADIAAITGQALPPAFLTYVTSGNYVQDVTLMSISNAQVDFALSTPGVWCFGPAYPVTDKGGHLNPNGSRWMGAMAGKVLRKVLVEKTDFQPLAPTKIEAVLNTIYVHFAPTSPLQFQACYVQNTPVMHTARGFRVSDDSGAVAVSGVEIIGGSIVAITLTRALGANPFVWYASQAQGGGGNLCDTDPTRSDDAFEFIADSGMYAGENVPTLAGKSYPLWNWCVPFRRAVGYTR